MPRNDAEVMIISWVAEKARLDALARVVGSDGEGRADD